MSDPTELDELEAGVTSGFFARLKAFVEREWGPAGETYQQAVRKAISGPLGSEEESVHRLKNIAFAQAEIQRLLQWPQERISHLKTRTAADARSGGLSRRGPGL